MTRRPRVKITNEQAVDLYTKYQHLYSTDLTEALGITSVTATRCIKYAREWGEEQSLYKIDQKQRYYTIPTETLLRAFDIDIKKALKATRRRV